MVISACETGKGELVRNEGVMSFARAFLICRLSQYHQYIVESRRPTTSEILRSFYKYLKEGYSKAKALQQAKLEFIRNNPIDRNPAYWSHLVLTGNPEALYKKKQPLFWWAVFLISCGTIWYTTDLKKKKKSTLFISIIGYLKKRCLNYSVFSGIRRLLLWLFISYWLAFHRIGSKFSKGNGFFRFKGLDWVFFLSYRIIL